MQIWVQYAVIKENSFLVFRLIMYKIEAYIQYPPTLSYLCVIAICESIIAFFQSQNRTPHKMPYVLPQSSETSMQQNWYHQTAMVLLDSELPSSSRSTLSIVLLDLVVFRQIWKWRMMAHVRHNDGESPRSFWWMARPKHSENRRISQHLLFLSSPCD